MMAGVCPSVAYLDLTENGKAQEGKIGTMEAYHTGNPCRGQKVNGKGHQTDKCYHGQCSITEIVGNFC